MSETTLRHIEHFVTTLGPRGSTTPQERAAHDYCQQTLEGLGYTVQREAFGSPSSGWHPYALASGLMLLAIAIFALFGGGADAQAGALAAVVLGALTTACFLLQVTHRDNPLAWFLPVDRSQNVWALAAPSGEVRRRVVVTGHVDSHRTALAMQSPALWQIFQLLTTIVGVANVALVGVFIWGLVTPDPLPRTLALWSGALYLLALVFTLQPDSAPYVVGANDNASGAAAVLTLAERLQAEPLAHTAVYLVNTGCEEVGCYGLMDWIRRHADSDAPDARYLILDNIAGRGSDVNYVLDETVLIPVKSDPDLVALAERVAAAHPALGAKPFHYKGLYSELSIASALGQKALGLLNFDPVTKMPPHFHTARDNLSNIDPAVLDRSEQFAWALLQALDAEAGA
ncbi:MAG: M28 family peptidase [Anaerolineales bacterium]|nr:M28 family peptidase [Anaerolineales bacterium]